MKSLRSSITRTAGFTLIELMITVAIFAILTLAAAPSLRDALLNARMIGQVNDTMADINIARSEAVKRNSGVVLCSSPNGAKCATATDWAQGWIVFDDVDADNKFTAGDFLIKVTPALSNTNPNALSVKLNGTAVSYVGYRASGATSYGAQPVVFTFCDARAGTASDSVAAPAGRQVTINATGRPLYTKFNCTAP